jgi:hypothetical protein
MVHVRKRKLYLKPLIFREHGDQEGERTATKGVSENSGGVTHITEGGEEDAILTVS